VLPIALLSFSMTLRAAEQVLSAKRAKALIAAAWQDRFREPVHLAYVEAWEASNDSGVRTELRQSWKIRGPLLHADEWCFQHPRNVGLKSRARLKITRGMEGYDVRDTADGWAARVRPAASITFNRAGPIQAYLRPIYGVPLLQLLADHPVVEGRRTRDGALVAGIAFSKAGADAIPAGREVWGALGWRCTFRWHNGESRLERIELMQTALVLDENRRRIPNPDLLPHEARSLWRGRIDAGVASRWVFSDFVRVGALLLPLRLDYIYPTFRGSVRVLAGSVRTEPLGDEDFAFKPPAAFGEAGMVTDRRAGKVYYQGGIGQRERVVSELVRAGDDIKKRVRAEAPARGSGAWLWIGSIVCALASVGTVLWFFRRSRLRARVDGP